MKTIRIIFILLVLLLIISCPTTYKKDSELFGNFTPVKLEGNPDTDYFVSVSEEPARIYLWQRINKNKTSETVKLIYIYDFCNGVFAQEGTRSIYPTSVTFLRGNIWICGEGMQKNFMRIHVATGKLTFLKLDCIPISVVSIPESVDGKGTLWCATRSARGVGIAIRQLDDEGNIIHKYNVKHEDIDTLNLDGLHYYNNSYVLFSSSHNNYTIEKIKIGDAKYKTIKLISNDNFTIEETTYSTVLNSEVLALTNYNNEDNFITSFWSHNSTDYIFPALIGYSSQQNKGMGYRFICPIEIKSDTIHIGAPILYTHDEKNEEYDIFPFYFYDNCNDKMYIIGNAGHDVESGKIPFNGFNMHQYNSTGDLQKRFFLPQAIQYNKLMDRKVWFGKSEYTQDYATRKWVYKGIGVYCFDEATEQLFLIDKDGNKTLIDGIDVNEP
ncbi:MAG: hypothetical protein IJU92_07015 [Spirochaetaceae bacterium]|nr:hypothetical protein [Spirochaetaceae bacterium]